MQKEQISEVLPCLPVSLNVKDWDYTRDSRDRGDQRQVKIEWLNVSRSCFLWVVRPQGRAGSPAQGCP